MQIGRNLAKYLCTRYVVILTEVGGCIGMIAKLKTPKYCVWKSPFHYENLYT